MIKRIYSELSEHVNSEPHHIVHYEYEILNIIYYNSITLPHTIGADNILPFIKRKIREDISISLNQHIDEQMSKDNFLASLMIMDKLDKR